MNERELWVTLDRIRSFQEQVAAMGRTEPDPDNYRASASGFLAEIDRMQREAPRVSRSACLMAYANPTSLPAHTAERNGFRTVAQKTPKRRSKRAQKAVVKLIANWR